MTSLGLSRTVNPIEVQPFMNAVAQSPVISDVQLAMMASCCPTPRSGMASFRILRFRKRGTIHISTLSN